MGWLYFFLGFMAGVCAVLLLILIIAVAAATPSRRNIGMQDRREGRTL